MPSSCLATSTCLLGYRWLYVSIVVCTFSCPRRSAISSGEKPISTNRLAWLCRRYDDVERGERGSSEEHLTVTQFKVQQEQARPAEFTEQNRQQEKQAATLGSKIEKIQNQRVDVRSIEKIVATSIPFSSKVAVEREDFDRLSTLAKKYVTAEKKESKLQKAVDAANKLIAKLKAEIDSLKQEISDYKSVHSKLRAAELERENTELRGKVRSYEDVIQRNNLWRFFHPHREKAVTRDEAR